MSIEEKFFKFALGLVCLSVLLAILTSCNPYQDLSPIGDIPTAQPTATAQKLLNHGSVTPTPRPITCTVNAGRVYLRKGAGMSHAAIEVLHAGEILTVIERGAWLKVSTRKHAGFIYSHYCETGE
jgi:hypothetical protein